MTKCLNLFLTLLLLSGIGYSQEKKSFTLEDIYDSQKFSGENLSGTKWIPGEDAYSYLEMNTETKFRDIWRYDVKSGKKSLMISSANLKITPEDKPFSINYYEWTSDGNYVLFTGTLVARSTKTGGDIYLFDRKKNTFSKVSISEGDHQIAQLSPDGKKLGYVRNNNLFVIDLATKSEKQLTFDGSDQILNGNFDWVYEEEFSIINGWQWSPDSRRIAFWRLDQTLVPQFKIPLYTDLHLNWNDYKYPKAGDPNSLVQIGITTIADGKTVWADIGEEKDQYIPRIKWTLNPELLSIQRVNRLQNQLDFLLINATTGTSTLCYSETSDTWVNVNNNLQFLKDGKSFLWVTDKDGFNHIYLIGLDGKVIRQLTKGEWEVGVVHGVDEKSGFVYFNAAKESSITNNLYRVSLKGGPIEKLSTEIGTHTISFHPELTYYIDRFSNSTTPTKTKLHQSNGKLVRVIFENKLEILNDYKLGTLEYFSVPAADETPLNAYMVKPIDFDPNKKYPVFMFVYGGPGSQQVRNSWLGPSYYWFSLLAEKGYLVVCVDNRGTGNRGKVFKSITYKKLGVIETDDQISAANWLSNQPFVDGNRIGIYGWSYGGYMAAMAIFKGQNIFKAAIAGAPVTHWKFYDTIYTERYMQTPQLNPDGYEISAPMTYAKNLKGNFLLIHGTADDNVHYQNTAELAKILQNAGLQFDMMAYTDKYHGVSGQKSRLHLQTFLTNWILRNL